MSSPCKLEDDESKPKDEADDLALSPAFDEVLCRRGDEEQQNDAS